MSDSRQATVSLWLVLVLPSSFIVSKYLGWEGTLVYATGVGVIVALRSHAFGRLSTRTLSRLVLLMTVLLAVSFLVIYPIANTHVPGAGSDDDDGLNLGARALLDGGSPYSRTTYLGNALHHLPGAFVLATPFVALGTSALQNLCWLPLFFLAVKVEADSRTALELALLVVVLGPEVFHEVVTGTGYASNAISVLLGLWWLARTTHTDAAAVAWGIALASRANFLFLVPLAGSYLYQHVGCRAAGRALALTCGTVAALTLPFYLHDPHAFGPLEGANRLLVFDQLLPHLGMGLIVMTALLAVVLPFMPMDRAALFRNCALVQALPVIAGLVLASVRDRHVDLSYARYGPFFAWFALMALAIAEPRNREQVSRVVERETPAAVSEAVGPARSSSLQALRRTRTESSSCRRA